MSCPPQLHRTDTDSSDYGSDFTPDEEEQLSELLSKAVAQHATVATRIPSSTAHITGTPALADASAIAPTDLESLRPAVLDALVADIEDAVEDVPGVRLAKVPGRENPRSPWRRASRRSPGYGAGSSIGVGPWRASPGADDRAGPSGMIDILCTVMIE